MKIPPRCGACAYYHDKIVSCPPWTWNWKKHRYKVANTGRRYR